MEYKKIISKFKIVIYVCIIVFIGSIVKEISAENNKHKKEREIKTAFYNEVKNKIKTLNEGLPLNINSETEWISVDSENAGNIQFNYKLINYTSSEINPYFVENLYLRNVTHQVCGMAENKHFLEIGGSYSYSYYGSDGKLLFHGVTTNKSCENLIKYQRVTVDAYKTYDYVKNGLTVEQLSDYARNLYRDIVPSFFDEDKITKIPLMFYPADIKNNKKIDYFFDVAGLDISEIDENKFRESIRRNIAPELCLSNNGRVLFRNGITIAIKTTIKSNIQMNNRKTFIETFSPSDCRTKIDI